MKLYIDSREKNLLPYITISHECKLLDVGDILYSHDDTPRLIIERKTITDMIASIYDGRYREQKMRLSALKCPILYLIEGDDNNPKFPRLAILSSLMRQGIFSIQTRGIQETAQVISILYTKLDSKLPSSDNIVSSTQISTIKKNNITPITWFKSIIMLIPNIGEKKANIICSHYKNIREIITTPRDEIEKTIGSHLTNAILPYIEGISV